MADANPKKTSEFSDSKDRPGDAMTSPNDVTNNVTSVVEPMEMSNVKSDGVRPRLSGYVSAKLQGVREDALAIRKSVVKFTKDVDCKKRCRKVCTLEFLKRRLPILQWLPTYTLQQFQGDFIAGMTVGLTVIPQSLAYAKIAKLPPQFGLYSAFMGVFVYMFLGTSRDVTFGPTAVMSLLTAEFCSAVEDDATIAIMLTFLSGVVQIIMGLLNIGFLVDYISHPVINSFTTAAAITIACSQIKRWLGLTNIRREFIPQLIDIVKKISSTRLADCLLGLFCMIILYCMKRMKDIKFGKADNPSRALKVFKYIVWLSSTARNAIVVVVASSLAAILVGQNMKIFILTGVIRDGLPPFQMPKFSFTAGNETYTAADSFKSMGIGIVIIPLLGVIESIAIGKAFGRKNNYNIDATQELLAIGISNIVASFVSSYPVTASFSRSAVNAQSGVRTPLGGAFTGALVLLALGLLTPLFYYIPDAALAAVIIMAVTDMIDFSMVSKLWKVKKSDLVPWFTAFIVSLLFGFEYGIILGVVVSLLMLLYPWSRPSIRVLRGTEVLEGDDQLEAVEHDLIHGYGQIVVVTISMGLKFPGIEHLQDKIMNLAFNDSQKSKNVILNMLYVSDVDYTTVQGIQQLQDDFTRNKAQIILTGVQPHIAATFRRAGIKNLQYAAAVADAVNMLTEANLAVQNNASTLGDDPNDMAEESRRVSKLQQNGSECKLTTDGSVIVELTTEAEVAGPPPYKPPTNP